LTFITLAFSAGVSKVQPAGQIRSAGSVYLAHGGLSVLTLNSAWKTYRTMSDCFHAVRIIQAHVCIVFLLFFFKNFLARSIAFFSSPDPGARNLYGRDAADGKHPSFKSGTEERQFSVPHFIT